MARFAALLVLVAATSASALTVLSRSTHDSDVCGMPSSLSIAPQAFAQLPGAGIKKFKPFKKVLKDGFMKTTCVKDYMYYHGDKYGAAKHSYEIGHVGVSIVHYNDWVAKEDRAEMSPKVCFDFCKTVPKMGFFGIVNGNKCYCEPYFKQMAGDSSMCDVACPGDKTNSCGGSSKSSIYAMHDCPAEKKKPAQKKKPTKAPKTAAKPSYVLSGVPLKAAKRNVVTLDSAKWPKDYCVDVDLTFPAKANTNKYGYEGTIAMLGQVDICVTHTKKLLGGGTGMGVMAIEQSNGKGPYFATAGVIAPGSRKKFTFCYKESTNEASFIVAGKVQGGYLANKKAKYPTTRNVKLSLLTGSHSSDTVEPLKGGQLHSLQIRPFESDFNAQFSK